MPASSCAEVLAGAQGLWTRAVKHEFLDSCAAGSIAPQQFDVWLSQDYQFVLGFTRCLASLLAAAPPSDFEVLIGGLEALRGELKFFSEKAQERSVDLSQSQMAACSEYTKLMETLRDEPYAVQAAAVWAIEYCYNEAWNRPMKPPYEEFAQRWGNEGFGAYVKQLEGQADAALQRASQEVQQQATDVCTTTAKLEVGFWQMALDA